MAYCGKCGAELVDVNVPCEACGEPPAGQYHEILPPPPPPWPGPPPKDELGKLLGIVALIMIIIVIVTIVVAAGLYLMVINDPWGETQTPAGSWDMVSESTTSVKIIFGVFTDDVSPMDIRIVVQENGTYLGTLAFEKMPSSSQTTMSWNDDSPGATAVYYDYNYAGGTINSGDRIDLEGLKPGTEYTFELIYFPTESVISMVGDGPSVSTQ